MLGPEYEQIKHTIPEDHARTSSAEDLLAQAMPEDGPVDVLDLGCGDGRGADVAQAIGPKIRYKGVDIEGSPEVLGRSREDFEFHSYDGVNLPFPDESFDLVYSRQVFEHVRHPDQVTREIRRVLRPGGVFVGSLSNLEPYHSFSIFNYTPYGVFRLIEDNEMSLRLMRPGPEGLSLIVRQLTNRRISRFGLVYPLIATAGKLRGWDARRRNYLKLRFSGHICFIADKG